MTFRGFEKAFPDGSVFLYPPSRNPLLKVLDTAQDMMFTWGVTTQHRVEVPVVDNMTHSDDRLPNKTYVWGIHIGKDAVCYTDDFLIRYDGPVNATVGGHSIVGSYDPRFESIGFWYNDSARPVTEIDFYGMSDKGQLRRVETLKPGMFWHVWVEYFPHTDINRTDPGMREVVTADDHGCGAPNIPGSCGESSRASRRIHWMNVLTSDLDAEASVVTRS